MKSITDLNIVFWVFNFPLSYLNFSSYFYWEVLGVVNDKKVWQECKLEFCWICLGRYPGYVHQNDTICGVRRMVTTIMLMMWVFFVASYSLYTDLWFALLIKWAFRTIGKFILANIIGLAILLTFPLSFGFVSWMNSYSYSLWDSFCKFFTGTMVIFYPMGWGFTMYFSYYSSTFSFIPMYIILLLSVLNHLIFS